MATNLDATITSTMTRKALGITLIAGTVLALGVATAQFDNLQIEDAPEPQPQQQPQQKKLVRVCSLNNVQANQEFQRNVRLVQSQRQQAIQLNSQIENASSPEEKQQFQQQLDTLMAKLNENNQKMVKTYGFSLTRNYTVVVETAHVYMFVSDAEAVRYQAKQNPQQNTQN